MRPGWDDYFMGIAQAVSARADCVRAQVGAVIVKDRRIVATGYNAAPSGGPSCLAGECPRGRLGFKAVPPGVGSYEECIALHAEQNAIAYADHRDTKGATIYVTKKPCPMCTKLIQASGVTRVVVVA